MITEKSLQRFAAPDQQRESASKTVCCNFKTPSTLPCGFWIIYGMNIILKKGLARAIWEVNYVILN